MLQTLREKTSGWIAGAIVVLIAVPFAFFGMEQYLFQTNATYAAKVEAPPAWWRSAPDWWLVRKLAWKSEEVSAEDFRSAFEQQRQQRREAEGDRFDARGFESAENKREVLETLVDQAVLRLEASRNGITAGDGQVREMIESIPAFQVDGKFDPQRYQIALQSQGQTPRAFQELVREGLQQGVIPAQVAQSAFVTGTETTRMLRLLSERRDVSFLVLPPPAADTGAVSAKEIQDWHAAHAGEFRAPETVTIEYLDIDASAVPAAPPPDEAALRQRYEQEKARFVEPEQRLASHILVRVDEGADAAAQKAAEDEATRLATQARQAGADFAALAREHSDDTGSQAAGGDLGWIVKDGSTAKPFEDALFALKAGEVGDPVRTPFGWHVLQLREVRTGKQVAFEDVRATLAGEQAQADRERGFNELIGGIVDEVYKNPTSLASAAQQAKLQVQTTGPFARGEGSGVAAIPAVERAAFSESLVQDGTVSDPIEVSPERSVLIRVTQHSPERALTVVEAREAIVAAIRTDRSARRAEAEADALLARLRNGETLQALATERGTAVQSVPGIPRGAPVPDAEASEAYFQADAPAEGKPSVGKVASADGSMLLFAVDKVVPGNPDEASEEERTMFRQQMSGLFGGEDAQTLLQALRKTMKITVVEARL